ncbi:MAG: S1 RNA-binding domain-containing protein [Anaerolineae bacterium]
MISETEIDNETTQAQAEASDEAAAANEAAVADETAQAAPDVVASDEAAGGPPDAGDGPTASDAPTGDDATPAKPDKKRAQRGRRRTELADLVVGSETKGRVVGLAKYGCFVDIGAVTDGLVHVTEFPSKRVREISDEVQQGDEVEVWIKDVDSGKGRISLSMRKKPKRSIRELHAGDVLSGTVTTVTKYGAFVDIASDTEGLVHISEMSSGYVEKPTEIVNSGATVEVRVKEIDLDRERISLSMVGLANDLGLEAAAEAPDADDEYAVEEPEERMPTVVELALRRALGEMQDEVAEEDAVEIAEEADGGDADSEAGTAGEMDTLGEVYERMLEEYRASKSDA